MMTHDELQELLVLAAEAGTALNGIIATAEQHAVDTPADAAVLLTELVQHVADVLGPERFGRLVDLAEQVDGDPVARRDLAVCRSFLGEPFRKLGLSAPPVMLRLVTEDETVAP